MIGLTSLTVGPELEMLCPLVLITDKRFQSFFQFDQSYHKEVLM